MEPNAEQIKRALEICANNGDCKECPINPKRGNYGYCTSLAIKHALAFINEQEQRIEELTKIAEFYRKEAEKNAECRIKSAE